MTEPALHLSSSEQTVSRGVRQVLVCDDDLAVRYTLKRLLIQQLFSEVIEAENGLLALKLMRERPPDLLILDLHMPVLDGIETLAAIRETPALKHVPVVVLTGERNADVVRRVIELGVLDYISKPLSKTGTLERLKRVINEMHVEAPAAPPRQHEPVERGCLRAGNKLLVADGSEDFRYFIRTAFGTRFRIIEAITGIDALDLAMSERPHGVIIGRELTQMSSDHLAEKLRGLELRRDLVLIGVGARQELERLRDSGLYDACVPRTFVPALYEQMFEELGPSSLPLSELLESCPSLRSQMASAAEQVFGMMLRMDVEPHDRVITNTPPPYARSVITLAIEEQFTAYIELVADQVSADAFAVAMFGLPEASEAMLELSNIIAGRVKHAITGAGTNVVLGLPEVKVVDDGPPDVRPKDSLGMRFGVVGADHELEIRLRVAKRQPNDAATPTSARV